jgi:hypothetical protein
VTFTDVDNPASTLKPWPRSDTTFSTARASSSRRAVTFQPAHLAYDGEVCDTLMFMAQLCLDRARALCRRREREAPDWAPQAVLAVRAGRQFASYALVIIAERARVLVHELGHVYLGGSPHCGYDASILSKEVPSPVADHTGAPRWRSCFDVASWAFLARVQPSAFRLIAHTRRGAPSRRIAMLLADPIGQPPAHRGHRGRAWVGHGFVS